MASVAAAAPDDPVDPWRRAAPDSLGTVPAEIRLGLPRFDQLWFDGDDAAASRYLEAVTAVVAAVAAAHPGLRVVEVDLEPFLESAALLYGGAFVAERYAAVGPFVERGAPDLDPIVRTVIAQAGEVAGWEVFRDLDELQRLRRDSSPTWDEVDVFVVPTVPRLPTVTEVAADPIGVNAMLGTYTNFVNLMDLAALTIPVRSPSAASGGFGVTSEWSSPPASVTLIGPAWSDDLLLRLGSSVS